MGARDAAQKTVNGVNYRIQRYRPRIEGLFARIERWTSAHNSICVNASALIPIEFVYLN